MKRAERRHQENRIRAKFREVAKRWAGRYDSWANQWKFKRAEDGGLESRRHVIDNRGFVKRAGFIERTAARLSHHNKCPCGMCHGERYRNHRHKERVLDKTYIEEDRDE